MEDVYIKGSSEASIHDSIPFKDCVGWREKDLQLLLARYFCCRCVLVASSCVKTKGRKEKEGDYGGCYIHCFFLFGRGARFPLT